MISPNADCSNCTPSHPYRLHNDIGVCVVPGCPCVSFAEMKSKTLSHCPICGRHSHINGHCPYRVSR